jgi:hypothetical protein
LALSLLTSSPRRRGPIRIARLAPSVPGNASWNTTASRVALPTSKVQASQPSHGFPPSRERQWGRMFPRESTDLNAFGTLFTNVFPAQTGTHPDYSAGAIRARQRLLTNHRQPGCTAEVAGPGAPTVAWIPAFAGKTVRQGQAGPNAFSTPPTNVFPRQAGILWTTWPQSNVFHTQGSIPRITNWHFPNPATASLRITAGINAPTLLAAHLSMVEPTSHRIRRTGSRARNVASCTRVFP